MLKEQEINLVTLMEEFGSDDRCRARLEKLRWPAGVECSRCASKRVVRRKNLHHYHFQCKSCRYDFSVTSGTIFHDTHLPLWK
ncbi:MAG: transposase [Rubrobacter sp.]|nr:transposase [Rubrobacter sp.]